MWLNSMQREEPYLALTCISKSVKAGEPARAICTGAAWLSSARVVRCWVKSRNERNPYVLLPLGREIGSTLGQDCLVPTRRKVGMTSSQYGPYGQGCTRTTMPSTEGRNVARRSKSHKNLAQFGLSSATRRHEAGIASNGASATAP